MTHSELAPPATPQDAVGQNDWRDLIPSLAELAPIGGGALEHLIDHQRRQAAAGGAAP